jgi:hypothetical protein
MNEFWRNAFAPVPPRSAHDAAWPWRALLGVFDAPSGLRYRFASGYVVLALAGFVVLWRRRRETALLLCAPIVVTIGAAVAHLYPFEGRLVLFLTPAFLLAAAAAASALATWAGRATPLAAAAIVFAIAFPPLERIALQHPLYRIQETPALLEWLRAHRRPGDAVYVWYRATQNVAWYGAQNGLPSTDVVEGGCWLAEPRMFLRDIDRYRGRPRVWFVMAGGAFPQAKLMRQYADSIGTRREQVKIPTNVAGFFPLEVWGYDFSDSTRLTHAAANDVRVDLPPPGESGLLSCTSGPWSRRTAADHGLAND